MNKNALIIIMIGLLIGGGIFFLGGSKSNKINEDGTYQTNTNGSTSTQGNNVEIKDGIQYITINAKGGYSPRISSGKAGIPTKLVVKTNGTYDCSAALSVRSANFQKVLANTGEEVIDLGIPVAGTPIRGVCGMGMYSFEVDFN